MPPLFDIRNLSLHLGGKTLLDAVSFSFTDQRKIAFIGRNGVGKSTLCKIIIGEATADSGDIYRHAGLRLGFLRQDENFHDAETLGEYLQRDTQQPLWQCAQLAHKFALTAAMFAAPIANLSGGWRMRVKLTALLLHEPNFLLLDEPTNFLDLRTQLLLQKFLQTWRGGALVVSHDRAFLDATCEHTLELTRGQLTYSPLKVSAHLQRRREQNEHHARTNVAKLAKRRQLQTFIDKNRAGANTAAQARSKQKQLDRIELAAIEVAENSATISLPSVARPRQTIFTADNLAIGYGEKIIARQINFSLEPAERWLITGDNGQGKTTLLKTLTQALPPVAGKIHWGHNLSVGVYAQHVYQTLPAALTVREYLLRCNRIDFNDQQVLNTAGGFLFSGDDVDKKIAVLSGGERARLCLAGLFLAGNNVLVLDEPSNHLDVETAEALATALSTYQGGVIFVSHERSFAEKVATDVLELAGGASRRVLGGFAAYLEELTREDGAILTTETAEKNFRATKNATTVTVAKIAEVNGREKREREKRQAALERKLEKIDAQIAAITAAITAITYAADAQRDGEKAARLARELAELRTEKNATEDEWLANSF